MNRRTPLSLVALVVSVLIAPCAFAQSTAPIEAMYHWGPVNKAVGQAIALNVELTDHFGDPSLTVPVEFHLEDKDGKVVYSHTVTLSAGRSVSEVFTLAAESPFARRTIDADIYAVVGPDIRLLQPCLKVVYPPGPTSPADQLFATLEVIDVFTGRVQALSLTPDMRKAGGIPQ